MEIRNADGLTEAEFLASYKPSDYERPSVTVDLAIFGMDKYLSSLKVLLIKRGNHPYMNCWALAGGFVGIDESAYSAASRELKEETGLENVYLEQVYTMSQPNRDPRMRVIDIAYMSLIPVTKLCAGDDAKEAEWFDVKLENNKLVLISSGVVISYDLINTAFKNGKITVNGYKMSLASETALAFDHAEIILESLLKLRERVESTDIAFNLVPDVFTLPDLKSVYETILGRQLYTTNFKADIGYKIEPVGYKINSIVGERKSNAYKYRG